MKLRTEVYVDFQLVRVLCCFILLHGRNMGISHFVYVIPEGQIFAVNVLEQLTNNRRNHFVGYPDFVNKSAVACSHNVRLCDGHAVTGTLQETIGWNDKFGILHNSGSHIELRCEYHNVIREVVPSLSAVVS